VLSTALFYVTPILYTTDSLVNHPTLRHLIMINPLAPIFELARKWVIQPSAPGPVEAAGGWLPLVVPIALYLGICVVAVWTFNREAPRIAEQL
jgi:ABC-2 type transport system permease protein